MYNMISFLFDFHTLEINYLFFSRLVQQANKSFYLGGATTCLHNLKVLLMFSTRQLKNNQLNKPFENQMGGLIVACTDIKYKHIYM